jgi:hypothetical protein
VLGWIGISGDVARFSLVSLRLCVWLGGVIEVLQLKGVGQGDVIVVVVGPWQGCHPPVLIMAVSQYVTSGWQDGLGIGVSGSEGVSSHLMQFRCSIFSHSSTTCMNSGCG